MLNLFRAFSINIILLVVLVCVFYTSASAQTLYTCEGPRRGPNPFLHTVNPETGATTSTVEINLPGFTIQGCNGLSKDPLTGSCWIVLTPPSEGGTGSGGTGNRLLATIDANTGLATLVGATGERIAGIAFNETGTILYGITGDGDAAFTPKLLTLSKSDGSSTFVQNLFNEDEPGEAMGFNPDDGLLYRSSGDGPVLDVELIYESINPFNNNVTQIPITGNTAVYDEQLSFVYLSDNTFLVSQGREPSVPNALHSITTDGLVSFIANMDHQAKGMAFNCGVPDIIREVPTLSEWGLAAMAGILGIVGFMVMRRRKLSV